MLSYQMKVRPFFIGLAIAFIIIVFVGISIRFVFHEHGQLWSMVIAVLADEYNLDYDTFITLPDGRDINFLNYLAGPGKYLSKHQLKAILGELELNKPNNEGIYKSIEIIKEDPDRRLEIESWISSYTAKSLEDEP